MKLPKKESTENRTKIGISVTIDKELLEQIDKILSKKEYAGYNRSQIFELALKQLLGTK